nr:hypothetical protein [uncultured bacterium]
MRACVIALAPGTPQDTSPYPHRSSDPVTSVGPPLPRAITASLTASHGTTITSTQADRPGSHGVNFLATNQRVGTFTSLVRSPPE